ncbi:ribosome biogenesis protein ytm1 [Cryomyces antarcticus]|uniref:Ribosome biogenesis protein ytm1 n=1 Tax=Cryomyces antarcticus TaxID=329879 RepID=A0ABR0KTJ0_9PEZI|nr:ribosome biogenesis protein ytm1 [Cryomyces antarcticus]
MSRDLTVAKISIDGDGIEVSGVTTDVSIPTLLTGLSDVLEYLGTRLPPAISIPLSEILMPSINSRLLSGWLEPAIPLSLEGMQSFEQVLGHVLNLADNVEDLGWSGKSELVSWVERTPRTWLAKRREAALAATRRQILNGLSERRVVERVETQTVQRGEVVVTGDQGNEDWNAAWDNGGGPANSSTKRPQQAEDDQEASAWGLDDGEGQVAGQNSNKPDEAGDAGDDAWGWDDADEGKQSTAASPTTNRNQRPNVNGDKDHTDTLERELTLKETYTVTAVPDGIMEIVQQVISDAEALGGSRACEGCFMPLAASLRRSGETDKLK